MKKTYFIKWGMTILILLTLVVPSFIGVSSVKAKTTNATNKMVKNQILVKFTSSTTTKVRNSINASNKVKKKHVISGTGVEVLTIPSGKSVQDMVNIYKKNKNVVFAEPNYIASSDWVPNDPYYFNQTGLKKMNPESAWDISLGDVSVPVAVLDTGASFNHEDLSGIYKIGYDFINNDIDPADDGGHGTMVSGIIAANANNSIGVAGASSKTPIIPVKVLGSDGTGSYSTISQGIIWAVDNGAKVINMSLSGSSSSSTLKSAIDYAYRKGVVLVGSAGNSNGAVGYPAAYSNVIAVAAVDNNDIKSTYSSFGPEIALTAPGNSIYSTDYAGGYRSGSGTSFSAPFVSSLAAMILSVKPDCTPDQVLGFMKDGVKDLGTPGWDQYYGYGRVDYLTTLRNLSGSAVTPAPDNTKPIISLNGVSNITLSQDTVYIDEGAIAVDNQDGDITSKIMVTNGVNSSIPGIYKVAYNVSDSAGNQADTIIRTVTVQSPINNVPVSTTQIIQYTGNIGYKGQTTVNHIVVLKKDGTISLNLQWDVKKTNLDLYLYDSSNKLINSSKLSTNTLEKIEMPILSGTYTIKVVAVSGKGNYTINGTVVN